MSVSDVVLSFEDEFGIEEKVHLGCEKEERRWE